MRNDVQIWVDADKMDNLRDILQNTDKRFIHLKERGEFINRADIQGIYNPKTIEEYKRRKNGQWKCKHGNWHDSGSDCESENCLSEERKKKISELNQAIEDCDNCKDGWTRNENGNLIKCSCVKQTR